MKTNKGFAPVLALLIILGIVVVGGAAYYAGTKNNTSNPPTSNTETSDRLIGGDKDEHGCLGAAGYSWCAVKNKCLRVWEEKCEATPVNSQSSITVLSPNGGEVWTIGSKHTIKWSTKNIPSTDKVSITIGRISPPALPTEGQEFDPIIFTDLKNSGSIDWTVSNMYPAGNYIITINGYHSLPLIPGNYVSDQSDKSFAITSSTAEVFKYQPGAIKSITVTGNNQWTFAVDLLSPNTKWTPGGTETFFINQNPMIRNLNVTSATKTYNCNPFTNPGLLVDTSSFISGIQANKNSENYVKDFVGPVRYFDINGTNITAMYEQCLP